MKRGSLLYLLGFLMLLIPTSELTAGSALNREQTTDLFRQGTELFHQAVAAEPADPARARDFYHQAVLRFERITGEGNIHNGKLFYNIGNTYFKMNDLGRAILNYRRAQRLILDDPNLGQNLTYARSRCQDNIPERQEKKVLKTLFFWHYDLATPTRAMLFGFFFIAFWFLASIRLFTKRPALKGSLIASGLLSLALLGSLAAEAWTGSGNIAGVILAPEVIARKGDGETYQPSFNEPLHAGTEFDLLEDRGTWYRVELSDGRSCWLPAKTVGLVQ